LRFFDIIGPLMEFGIFDEGSGNDLRWSDVPVSAYIA
jgi:hypothetical protein